MHPTAIARRSAFFAALTALAALPTPASNHFPEPPPVQIDCPFAALPGEPGERLRTSHRSILVASYFGPDAGAVDERLDFEFLVDALIPGQGLPDPNGLSSASWADYSILQLEIPVHHDGGRFDEEPGYALFNNARFCKPGACPAYGKRGFWQAFRIREGHDERIECSVTRLRLELTSHDEIDGRVHQSILGAWLPVGDTLIPGDRVLFRYVGQVPARATDWLSHFNFRPHFRYRRFPPGCPPRDPDAQALRSCWTTLDYDQIQDIELEAREPVSVHVIAPLDAVAGVPFEVEVVLKDTYGNPATTPEMDLGVVVGPTGSTPFCTLSIDDDFSGRCSGTVTIPPALAATADLPPIKLMLEPAPAGLVEVDHYTRIHREEPPYRRLLGDTHIHVGLIVDGTDADPPDQEQFLRTWIAGDHRAQTATTRAALEYLEKVSVYDFGAISQHAVAWSSWRLPERGFSLFRDGQVCEVESSATELDVSGIGDWWTEAQIAASDYQRRFAGPDFVVYPAWEWHSQHCTPPLDLGRCEGLEPTAEKALDPENLPSWVDHSPLHRVVLFRDFDPEHRLPMLPGTVLDRSPVCLIRFLEEGLRNLDNEALAIPHMMDGAWYNIDWWLTYQDTTALLAILGTTDTARVEEYQRVGEIYSARNPRGDLGLIAFEGDWTTFDPADRRQWPAATYRYGWRDAQAHIGVIGSSDNHSQSPGVNDDGQYDKHEPTGTAVVLASTGAATGREAIFTALRDRRTYATSGVRIWLDFRLEQGASTWQMGDSVPCLDLPATATIEAAAGQPIRAVQLWSTEVGSDRPWDSIDPETGSPTVLFGGEVVRSSYELAPPKGYGEHVYYARVLVEATPEGQPREAAWSSPIWIGWQPSCGDPSE